MQDVVKKAVIVGTEASYDYGNVFCRHLVTSSKTPRELMQYICRYNYLYINCDINILQPVYGVMPLPNEAQYIQIFFLRYNYIVLFSLIHALSFLTNFVGNLQV